MLSESSRALGFLPQFSKILRNKSVGIGKYSSSAASVSEVTKETENKANDPTKKVNFDKFRLSCPDFMPRAIPKYRNLLLEKLERRDMIRRRHNIHIPEFYVGSILAVTTSDQHSPGKETRFVGICIQKIDSGLNSKFLLRNVLEHQGVEIMYNLYNPLIQKIEVLRLEKRLDDTLLYLRDAPQEYSTFPFDMPQEYYDESKPVPVNTIKVPLNPRPWIQRYERMDLKGVILPELSEKIKKQAIERAKPWEKYDLMDEYRKITPEEEQRDIFEEIKEELEIIQNKHKKERMKKVFVKPAKQKIF